VEIGAITSYIDVAQLVLYAFWIFFFGLVLYLRREDKREGYPLESDRSARIRVEGFPRMPSPKSFRLPQGAIRYAPRNEARPPELNAAPTNPWPGAPLQPTRNPLIDGIGPAAYAQRENRPDVTLAGAPRIVPMRVAPEFSVDERDPDLRGMTVFGADGAVVGPVTDLWVDRAEPQIRYIEVRAGADAGPSSVLLPIAFANIDRRRRRVRVKALLGSQFADVPRTAHPDQISLLEEDKITAYYAGGYLYAEPSRAEPRL
jgi:photosynthetic reaction center H subunit